MLLFGFIWPLSVQAQLDTTLPWPKFHKDIRNTGHSSNFGTTVGKLKWEFKTGADVVSSPALDNSTLYIGSDDNYVYAIDQKTGILQWKYLTNGAVRSSPAIDINGILYVGSNDGYLYAFDTRSINPLQPVPDWKYKFSASSAAAITSPPTIDELGNIYFGSNDGFLYSITNNGASASLNWRQPIGTSWGCPAIDLDTDRLFIGSWDFDYYYDNATFYGYDSFYILNKADGSRATYNRVLDNGTVISGYPYVEPGFNCIPGGIQASPVLTSDGSVIVSWLLTYDDWPDFCDDDFSENPVWKIPTGQSSGYFLPLSGVDTYSTPAMVTDNTYFVSSGPDIYKILPDGGTYYSVATIGERSECSPAVDGQLNIFVGSNGGYFYAISADSPETPILWQYPGEGEDPLKIVSVKGTEKFASIVSSPAIGNDNRHSVYVGASDGSVYAFYDGLAISGTVNLIDTVTSTSSPLSGVTVYLTDNTDEDAEIRQLLTQTDGSYQFPGVVENHSYTVSVEKLGYIFNPESKTVTVKTNDIENVDFEAFAGKTISGNIAYGSGTGVSGVSVSLVSSDGSVSDATTTDANGDYEFTGLSFETYTITPSKTSTGFSPPYQQVVIAATDPLSQNYIADFVATSGYQISGTVIDNVTDLGIAGALVTVTSTGGYSGSQLTDSNGAYSFVGLSAGTYTIKPSYQDYNFSPTSETKTIVSQNVDNVNFYAATGSTVSGFIYEGTSAIDNATTVELYTLLNYIFNEEPIRTVETDTNGQYSIIGVADGMYIVKPVLSGYSFEPATAFVRVYREDQQNINFWAASGLSISGRVADIFQLPYEDIQVTLSGSSTGETSTNASGQYIFTGLSAGRYTVSIQDDAFEFTPELVSVEVIASNIENKNFTASPICPLVYLNIPPFGPEGTLVNVYGLNFGNSDPSDIVETVTIGDTGISVTPGVYFGDSDPSTWMKADVEMWADWRVVVDAPGGFGFYNVWVVTVDDDGDGCLYQTPFPTNIFIAY